MIKAIIFDFDGVIHDTFELSFQVIKKTYPKLSLDDYRDFFSGNVYKNNKARKGFSEVFFKQLDKEYKRLEIKGGIKKELLMLGNKFDMFIVSSNMEKIMNNYFSNNNISYIFKEVLGLESHKSKIEKFELLLNKYELAKEDCVFVTDTLGDILEANKLDLNTIAVDYGFHERKRLERGNPIKIISSFNDIYSTIKNL